MSLDEIAEVLVEPATRTAALERARERVAMRIKRLQHIAASLDASIAAEQEGRTMQPHETLNVFGGFDPAEHTKEAEERWGASSEYADSVQRTSTYSKADWREQQDEQERIFRSFHRHLTNGDPPSDQSVGALVDEHREHISRWFYACTPQIHAGLGMMYVNDQRFRTSIDVGRDGLSAYMSAAITARYQEARDA